MNFKQVKSIGCKSKVISCDDFKAERLFGNFVIIRCNSAPLHFPKSRIILMSMRKDDNLHFLRLFFDCLLIIHVCLLFRLFVITCSYDSLQLLSIMIVIICDNLQIDYSIIH